MAFPISQESDSLFFGCHTITYDGIDLIVTGSNTRTHLCNERRRIKPGYRTLNNALREPSPTCMYGSNLQAIGTRDQYG